MDLEKLRNDWEELARADPLWAIMTSPGKKGRLWDQAEFFRTGERTVGRVLNHIDSLGVPLVHGRALDFGCGVGRLTQALAEHFQSVVGVDIAASMIEQAKALNPHGERCTFVVNTAPDLSMFPDSSFDFVYSNITLQHMPPRFMRRYLQEFVRILRPDGLIAFELTERPSPSMMLKRLAAHVLSVAMRRRGRIRMYWMRRRNVVSFMERSGARILDVKRTFEDQGWARFQYVAVRAPRE